MHRTQLYIPESLWKCVQSEALARRVSASEVVRDILAKHFVKVSKKTLDKNKV